MLAEIRSLWIGGALSRLERVCLSSFLRAGHKVYLYTYDEVLNIPEGVEVLDANLILPRDKIFTYGAVTGKGKGSYAGFANHFRYEMLLKCSNTYWVDMDVICLSPFYIENELDFGFENDTYINNAVIGTKNSGNKLFSDLSNYCNNPFQFTSWDTFKFLIRKFIGRTWGRGDFSYLPWGITGPKALTGFVKKGKLLNYAAPVRKYYPISSADWKKIFFASDEHINLDGAQAVHLWNEQLRRDNLDKNTIFDKESLYERLISELKLDE